MTDVLLLGLLSAFMNIPTGVVVGSIAGDLSIASRYQGTITAYRLGIYLVALVAAFGYSAAIWAVFIPLAARLLERLP